MNSLKKKKSETQPHINNIFVAVKLFRSQFIALVAAQEVMQCAICACPNGRGRFGVWFEWVTSGIEINTRERANNNIMYRKNGRFI